MYDASYCTSTNLRPYDACLKAMESEATILAPVHAPLSDAIGHVLASDLTAPISVPSFDNSAMDGFAFSSEAVARATNARPIQLPIVGASIAGDSVGRGNLGEGFAVKIMTGAPLPNGADTVLPVEAASWDHEKLTFYKPYAKNQHVRHVGQDVAAGTPILRAGTRLGSHHLPLLCGVGLGQVPVYPRPKMAWISTGQEISDDFANPLEPGHIYNATGLFGQTITPDMGMKIGSTVTVRDTPLDFAMALEDAMESGAQIILSTGGVSAGQYDFVKPVLEDMGARIIFHKARIKPAKPVLFAKLPNGAFFFGLPGNPISTALALRAFVYPFIRLITGLAPEPKFMATLDTDITVAEGKTVFLMATVEADPLGQMVATPHARQQSFQTVPFSESNAWLVVPEGQATMGAGQQVQWMPLNPHNV